MDKFNAFYGAAVDMDCGPEFLKRFRRLRRCRRNTLDQAAGRALAEAIAAKK